MKNSITINLSGKEVGLLVVVGIDESSEDTRQRRVGDELTRLSQATPFWMVGCNIVSCYSGV